MLDVRVVGIDVEGEEEPRPVRRALVVQPLHDALVHLAGAGDLVPVRAVARAGGRMVVDIEAAGEAEAAGDVVVGVDAGRVEALGLEALGQGGDALVDESVAGLAAVGRRAHAREVGGEGGAGPGAGRLGLVEGGAGGGELLQARRGGPVVAVEARVVGPEGVDVDQDDVLRRRGPVGAVGAAAAGQQQRGQEQERRGAQGFHVSSPGLEPPSNLTKGSGRVMDAAANSRGGPVRGSARRGTGSRRPRSSRPGSRCRGRRGRGWGRRRRPGRAVAAAVPQG